MTSAEGQSTTVLMGEKSSGQKIRAVTDSQGVTSTTETSSDGLYSATSLPDGTKVFTGSGWDSYRGSTYTKKTRLYLPSGKNIESDFDRIYSDLDNDGLADALGKYNGTFYRTASNVFFFAGKINFSFSKIR